jgi:hypothetical protein
MAVLVYPNDCRIGSADMNLPPKLAWIPGLVLLFCIGCSERTYPVTGKVVYKDTKAPIPGGLAIWFESTKPPEYIRSSGVINDDGTFSLSAAEFDTGALAGEHRVRFTPLLMGESSVNAVAAVMHPRYHDFDTSGLSVEVKSGQENNFVIEVERNTGKKPAVPPRNLNP